MYIGVDCGTQSTKVVVFDAEHMSVVGDGAVPHSVTQGEHGRYEQEPAEWVTAFEQALDIALKQAGVDAAAVKAISISGQQHGMVALDAQGEPVYPAKLWCDTESATENAWLIEALGGPEGCLEQLGVVMQTGYTASKVVWLRKHHPDAYKRIDLLLLPHDYLNFYLTGERVAEYGDASGTGYFDTRKRCWSRPVFERIAPELDPDHVLPRLVDAKTPVGTLRKEIAQRLGMSADVIVASGGGDNMMGAIGTGNIQPGVMTVSLGTSGTLYAYSGQPVIDDSGLVANFCSSNDGWLPLICTMNVTSATTLIRQLLGLDLAAFNSAAAGAPIGAGGVTLLPFFNGERVPPLPEATATFDGLSGFNTTAANVSRAVMEGATFGLRYGYDALKALGISPTQIRLIGGGAKSSLWRQMISDVMDVEVVCPEVSEAAALGAALQALWCERHHAGEDIGLAELCERAVTLDNSRLTHPDKSHVEQYVRVYQRYLEILEHRYPTV